MKRTINKPKKKSHKKKLEIKKNSKPLNKTKKDERNLTEVINKRYNSLIFIVIIFAKISHLRSIYYSPQTVYIFWYFLKENSLIKK